MLYQLSYTPTDRASMCLGLTYRIRTDDHRIHIPGLYLLS